MGSPAETEPARARAVETVAVLGAGTMGHGIAQVAALSGYRVILRDVDAEALARAARAIETNLEKGIQRGKVTEEERDLALRRIRGATALEETAQADLFFEAVPERMDLKRETLREVERVAAGDFVFATNTSSLSITEIAAGAGRPERVVGMHFFNPVHIMRLVEIVVGGQTSEETVETVRAVARRLRKEPITVRDVPGFASSRLGVALGLEAMRMLEQGVASAKDIDTAMELGYNHPMGPLRLTDLVGLDVRLSIAEYLHGALGSESFRPPEILRRMVARPSRPRPASSARPRPSTGRPASASPSSSRPRTGSASSSRGSQTSRARGRPKASRPISRQDSEYRIQEPE
ncbi:MAG: 3-hydroxyacyl-CoA dehydrogenase family protein [Acidobacteria bacterium]|nr:3-hydroxyacyl-CoA dehydrogenase family protein [Acidobacteriota bacterium]